MTIHIFGQHLLKPTVCKELCLPNAKGNILNVRYDGSPLGKHEWETRRG